MSVRVNQHTTTEADRVPAGQVVQADRVIAALSSETAPKRRRVASPAAAATSSAMAGSSKATGQQRGRVKKHGRTHGGEQVFACRYHGKHTHAARATVIRRPTAAAAKVEPSSSAAPPPGDIDDLSAVFNDELDVDDDELDVDDDAVSESD